MDLDKQAHFMHKVDAVSDEILRDYFAASALSGMLAQAGKWDPGYAAIKAYAHADAMMKCRVMKTNPEYD